jgi:hypothetical protein
VPWKRSLDYYDFVQRLIGKRNDSHRQKTADLLIGGYVDGQSELNAMKCVCLARSDLIKTLTRWRIRHRTKFSKPKCQRLWNSTPLSNVCRLRLKCDGTCAEKRTSPFKSTGVSPVDYWQASCAHQPAGFVLLVQACVLLSCDAYWLPTPFASFPFTSSPVRHRVPSHFKRSLLL